jgi:hypothetical protein
MLSVSSPMYHFSRKESPVIKYYYPDGTHCYRALHTVHAVFRNDEGRLMARAETPGRDDMYEFEITGFELVGPGVHCT